MKIKIIIFSLTLLALLTTKTYSESFTKEYVAKINKILIELDITYDDVIKKSGGKLQLETDNLIFIGADVYGRDQYLQPDAAKAYEKMVKAAKDDGINIYLVSAFRSVEYQQQIIQRKLNNDQSLKNILLASAIPGFSEHHTGKAVDLHTDGVNVLQTEFSETNAYKWLLEHAFDFGFRETYSKESNLDIMYEPWHWYYFK